MKRIIFLTISFILLVVIINMVKSLYDLYSKKDVLIQTQQKLTELQQQHNQLQKDLKKSTTQQFIEQQARDKLFLVKPGESMVILPNTTSGAKGSTQKEQIPNWQQWWGLFF